GETLEILDAPEQWLAAVQHDRKIGEAVPDDVLLHAPQQLLRHPLAHQLRLVVDRGVAKPVAVGAIDVAAGRDLDQQLRDRLMPEIGVLMVVSRHTNLQGAEDDGSSASIPKFAS